MLQILSTLEIALLQVSSPVYKGKESDICVNALISVKGYRGGR